MASKPGSPAEVCVSFSYKLSQNIRGCSFNNIFSTCDIRKLTSFYSLDCFSQANMICSFMSILLRIFGKVIVSWSESGISIGSSGSKFSIKLWLSLRRDCKYPKQKLRSHFCIRQTSGIPLINSKVIGFAHFNWRKLICNSLFNDDFLSKLVSSLLVE